MRVKLTPNATHERIVGLAADDQGTALLKIAVTAVPENGRANKALINFVAKQWRVPKSKIALQTGAKDRIKTLHIADDDPTLLNRLENWACQLPQPFN